MRTRISAVVVAILVVASIIGAQSGRGQLAGSVRDSSGSPLPGVTITLSGPERRTTVTNGRGEFTFVNLLPGVYEIRAELTGFTTRVAKTTVIDGQTARVSFELTVGTVEETITVTGEAPQGKGRQRAGAAGRFIAVPVERPRFNTEAYDHVDENGLRRVANDPLSTFSIDVDTASYANVRRFLTHGTRPPAGAVRIEELINYFRFDYPQPSGDAPFSVTTELAECPWNPEHRLALIGIQGRAIADKELAPRNLVFLIDVSGSMDEPDKLPLVRNSMRMLVDVLMPRDRVAIVVYAGASGLVLPSTPGDHKEVIHRAIAQLEAGGSTNGAAGIKLAYQVAAAELHQRRRESRDPRHRRRLQRRRHKPGRARSSDRDRARERRLPFRAGCRHRQPEGFDDGEACRQGQRELCVPRFAA